MMRSILTLVLCLGLLASTPMAFAEKAEKSEKAKKSVSTDGDVYITPNGKKYHKSDCPFVHERQVAKVSKKDAIDKKLGPCPKCFKEELPTDKEKK